jgi:hypothetical protein
MPLDMQALSDKFGVAITGVDLSKDMDEKLFNEIVDVFVKKQVLVFREGIKGVGSLFVCVSGENFFKRRIVGRFLE